MTISVELTFEQLVKAIEKLPPEETEQLARVIERHRGKGRKTIEEDRMRRIQAVRRLAAMELPVSDWEEMEREIIEARLEAYKRCSDVPL